MEKIKLDENMCIGCMACVCTAEKNFDFSDTHAVVIDDNVTAEAKVAAENCPVGAIKIVDEPENKPEEETESK